ncbi:hypothetical protein F5Y04DRAFT_277766 [Hypomontagnella monticulosa]|nr:hypothetical protein F5Y04DRAFT_277766 [Hypomontagnella monticulosa]
MPPKKRTAEDAQPVAATGPKTKKQKTAATAPVASTSASASTVGPVDPSVIRQRAYTLRNAVYRQIKKQMKWTPSCRYGSARWSYTSSVPNPAVFFRMFRLEPTGPKGKKWKQKKMPIHDFEGCIGEVEGSLRWGTLRLMPPHVNMKWNEEDNMFTVSGKYGLAQIRHEYDAAEEEAQEAAAAEAEKASKE